MDKNGAVTLSGLTIVQTAYGLADLERYDIVENNKNRGCRRTDRSKQVCRASRLERDDDACSPPPEWQLSSALAALIFCHKSPKQSIRLLHATYKF